MWDWAAVRGVRLLNCSFSAHSVQFQPSATPCTKVSSMISWYTRQLEAQKEGKKQVHSVLAKSASMSLARAWSGG